MTETRRNRFVGLSVILFAALVAVTPQFIRGNSCGHDFDVHLVSWLDCANAWRHGILYPHWTPSANWGAGEPRFVFYPPLTWMLGAALGLALPWSLAPIALTFLILAGSGLATRALALEACNDAVSTLAGCAAVFSGFTLFTAYERAAFPEFMGGVCLPLLVLYVLRDRAPTGSLVRRAPLSRAFDGSTVPLALALGCAWLSNAPLGVMASYLLAALALLWALLRKSWAPVLRAAVATILAFGVTAFYWIPSAFERKWVDIRQAYEDPGYNFENSWAFGHSGNPILAAHDVVLRTASIISVTMIAVAVAGVFVCWRRGILPLQRSTGARIWIPLAAVPLVVLVLLFPISRPIWVLLPQWRFLQYPWRWMEAVEAPMAIFFAAALWPRVRRGRVLAASACAAAFLAATVYAGSVFFQVCYPEDTVASTLADFRSGAGFEGMYEYEPPNADRSMIAMGLPAACLVDDPTIEFGKQDDNGDLVWSAAQGTCQATFRAITGWETDPEHLRIRAATTQAGFLVLRLLAFPAWSVRVNGQPAAGLPLREDGLIAVPVPAGEVNVTVDWTTTPDVILSRWVSGVSALLLLAVSFFERRKSSSPRLS
jgi:6-pyruvoyl-tetrahydropterin synthase related domain